MPGLKLRPADEVVIALLVVAIFEMRRAGDQAAKIRKLAEAALEAADPSLWDRIKNNALDAVITKLLF